MTEKELKEYVGSETLMGLGPDNTITDFIQELYEKSFREILGEEVMDRCLGSFSKEELFNVLYTIFQQGIVKIA